MKAALFHGPHKPLTIENVEVDKPLGREVLVRTVASGVCHSDLHFVDGFYPFPAPAILGHEAAGIVEAVGPYVNEFKAGDHVIACLSVFCGTCDYCLTGKTHLCQTRPVRRKDEPPKLTWNGQPVNQFANLSAYAEKMLVHENAIVKIDDEMPFAQAALIGCGVTTGVGAALNTARVEPGSTVAVFGAGGVGLAVIQGARIAGARMIIAVDTVESKFAKARELGATHTVNMQQQSLEEVLRDLRPDGADVVCDATGASRPLEDAIKLARPNGQVTKVGWSPDKLAVDMNPLVLHNVRIQGSFSHNYPVWERVIHLLDRRLTRPEAIVGLRSKLDGWREAFDAMHDRRVIKSVLLPNGH